MEESSIDVGFDAPVDSKMPIFLAFLGILIGGLGAVIAWVGLGKCDRLSDKVNADVEELRNTVNMAVSRQNDGGNAKELAALRSELEALRSQISSQFESVDANQQELAKTVESLSKRRAASQPAAAEPKTARGNAASAGTQSASGEYTVEAGDNFWKIAKKLKCKVSEIEEANPGVDSARLRVGQKLKVPAK